MRNRPFGIRPERGLGDAERHLSPATTSSNFSADRELLKQIEPQRGGDRKSKGGRAPVDRKSFANGAGLSLHQQKQALRVANIPRDDFERRVAFR